MPPSPVTFTFVPEDLAKEASPRRIWARGWLVAIVLLLGLAAIGVLLPRDAAEDDPLTTPTTNPTAPTAPSPPEPETSTTLGYEEFTLSGRGRETVAFEAPDDLATVLHITHDGRSTFTVRTFDADTEPIETLVDTEGAYEGSRAVNLVVGDIISGIEIVADGEWSITATYLGSLERNVDEVLGTGDDVVLMDLTSPAMRITHDGRSDFSVFLWAFDSQGYLINDSGEIDATVAVPVGGVVIEIHADGNWRLSTQG